MRSVFNTALLARLRRQTAESSLTPDRTYPANIQSYDQNTGATSAGDRPGEHSVDDLDPLLLPPVDPDANIDPDDAATSDPSPPLPPMPPCSWWIRMTLDPPDTPVSVEDARLCVSLVSAHLCQASQEALSARLMARQGGNSGGNGSHDGRRDSDSLAFPSTVGQLHEVIENLGPTAWRKFTRLWEIACEIPAPPENRPLGRRFRPGVALVNKTTTAASPVTTPSLDALRSMPPPPRPDAAELEPGLRAALPSMPTQVAGWLRHQPRDPPPWVHRESAGEKAEREFLQDQGRWPGG